MIIKRFEDQVKLTPNKIAIKTGDSEITYEELNNYGNKIGNKLIKSYNGNLELEKIKNVALFFDHGIDMIAALIGTLKANRTYVPIEPSYPFERVNYIIKDAEIGIILTDDKNLEFAMKLLEQAEVNIKVINVNNVNYSVKDTKVEKSTKYNEITYILYTSGSTGNPKGVYQCEKNILHFIKSYTKELDITYNDKMTLFSSLCHDAAIMDIYGSLLNGATLYPVNIKVNKAFRDIIKWLEKEEITIWHSVPTVYRYLISALSGEESLWNPRFIVLGGENIIENDINSFKRFFNHTKLMNLYGQTESSFNSAQIFSTNKITSGITIGKPVKGTEIIVVDENREEVLPLNVGEIVIISDYIALGYWKNRELTEQAFEFNNSCGKLYWTGDLGRVLKDGNIKFVGRKNSVVKIRGYRIDIGDIESNLLDNEDIKQVAVIDSKGKNDEGYLSAFLVSDTNLDMSKVKNFISRKLPEYMIPNHFVQVDSLPTTQSGKIDKKSLVENLANFKNEVVYESPRNKTEEKLIEIWCKVLGLNKIGINDNFFELGGHSLKAIVLTSKIHKELNVELPLKELFNSPTIKEVSKYIENSSKNSYIAIEKVEEKEYYEASSAQKRMYMLQQFNIESTAYNMPAVFELEGEIDKERIESTFKKLVQRHDSLRTYFETIGGEIIQKVDNEYEFKMPVIRDDEENSENIIKKFIRAFDLKKAPLFRVEIIEIKEKNYLLIDLHHIISDGISMSIFNKRVCGFI